MSVAVLAVVVLAVIYLICNAINTEERRSLNPQKCTLLSSTDQKLLVGLSVHLCLCVNQGCAYHNRHIEILVIMHAQTC